MTRKIKNETLESLAKRAVNGSKTALEKIIADIQEPVYSFALRMLFNPEDAEDAAQEILTIVITSLKTYRHEGAFRSWMMRIAANKIKAFRKSYAERRMAAVDDLDGIIDRYEAKGWFSGAQDASQAYLEAETRAVCTHAILLCLNRPSRMAFILGTVMEVSSREGGKILGITEATYRKRLSRARGKIKNFLVQNCSLFDRSNRCQCNNILPAYLKNGWIDPDKPIFISKHSDGKMTAKLKQYFKEMNELKKVSLIYNSIPPSNFNFVSTVRHILENKEYQITSDP